MKNRNRKPSATCPQRTDVLTPEQRAYCMSQIRGRDTGPEINLRKALWRRGHRYRIGHGLPGKPDLVFVAARVTVFVDGCFWHGCPEHAVQPRTNADFWKRKIEGNVRRDREISRKLEALGWKPIRFWEHEIKKNLAGVVECVEEALRSDV